MPCRRGSRIKVYEVLFSCLPPNLPSRCGFKILFFTSRQSSDLTDLSVDFRVTDEVKASQQLTLNPFSLKSSDKTGYKTGNTNLGKPALI